MSGILAYITLEANSVTLQCLKWLPNFFWFTYSFIHMCIHCLGHLSPEPPALSLPTPQIQFCWREDISNNKKDIAILLVWDKDNKTESFLALLPCKCVLQPELVHLYQAFSQHPGHPPIVTSVSLRLLY
jgi:hypothetical protein